MILPARGRLLVNTDLHGNYDDFHALERHFRALHAACDDAHWLILGDVVHAPSPEARAFQPELYDYEDGSWAIVHRILALRDEFPERIHYVLGNHDFAHIGGPHTAKFFDDEAAHLEEQLAPAQREELRRLFSSAHLCVLAPCGALFSHGAPGLAFQSLSDVFGVRLPHDPADSYARSLIDNFTLYYGQTELITRALLERVSRESGLALRFVVHGHDRDEEGWFASDGLLLCPCIFGAARMHKRFLVLALDTHYTALAALRDGVELLRVHDPS